MNTPSASPASPAAGPPPASPGSDPVRRAVRELQAETAALEADCGGALSDVLAAFLSAQYALAVQAAVQSAGAEGLELGTLRAFTSDVTALRRGDHSAARLELERESRSIERQRRGLEAERVMLDMDEYHLRWKSKQEMAMQAFEKLVDRKQPQAKAAFEALALAVRGPAVPPTNAAVGAAKPAPESGASAGVGDKDGFPFITLNHA
jgi:hypothetical protein